MYIDPHAHPYLKSLTACLTRVVEEGFTEKFCLAQKALQATSSGRLYSAPAIDVINCFRFEGKGHTQDEIILLILQAPDGTKGTFLITEQNRAEVPHHLWLRCERKAA